MEVTVEPKTASSPQLCIGEDYFYQDKCTKCSPSKWPIVGPLPALYLGRGPGPLPINRTSHSQGRQDHSNLSQIHSQELLPLRGCSSFVLFIISP